MKIRFNFKKTERHNKPAKFINLFKANSPFVFDPSL